MRISIFTLLTAVSCALVTSCYPPSPNPNNNQTPITPAPNGEQVINDEGQRQLEEARMRLENNSGYQSAPAVNNGYNTTPPNYNQGPAVRPGTVTYPYATKVPNRAGFVFNPYTKNQVDVRGIPAGTLVLDPNDSDSSHKFRVP